MGPAKTVKRELLTDYLLDQLKVALETGDDEHVAVGDHEAPAGGGWTENEGTGEFVNYVVITTLPAGDAEGTLAAPVEVTWFPYALTAIGASRKAVENAADRARSALTGLKRDDTADDLRINYVTTTGYGSVDRIDGVSPPIYALSDTVNVHTNQQ